MPEAAPTSRSCSACCVGGARGPDVGRDSHHRPPLRGCPSGLVNTPNRAVDLLHHLDTWSAGPGAQISDDCAAWKLRRHLLVGSRLTRFLMLLGFAEFLLGLSGFLIGIEVYVPMGDSYSSRDVASLCVPVG